MKGIRSVKAWPLLLLPILAGAGIMPVEEATLYRLYPQTRYLSGPSSAKATITWYDAQNKVLRVDGDFVEWSENGTYRWRRGLFMSPLGSVKADLALIPHAAHWQTLADTDLYPAYEILDNGRIRVGINGTLGGAIDYLAKSSDPGRNFVNRYDAGRLVQKSFMGLPYTYYWPGISAAERFPWNPIMGGYWEKDRKLYSGALEFEKSVDGRTMYVKCQPITFGSISRLDRDPERTKTYLETWFTLEENVSAVKIESKFTNWDTVDHAQWRDQELLAVYVTTDLTRLWTYDGIQPFTGAPPSLHLPPIVDPFHYLDFFITGFSASENWVAWTDTENFGVGAFAPEAQQVACFRYGAQGIASDDANETNEFSIVPRFSVAKNSIRRDLVYLLLDSLQGIRDFAYLHARQQWEDGGILAWEFSENGNRQGWAGGWEGAWDDGHSVIDDSLGVRDGIWSWWTVPGRESWIVSPHFRLTAGEDTIEIRLAAAGPIQARLLWNRLEDGVYDFREERSQVFKLIPDGSFHSYRITPRHGINGGRWSGTIRQIIISGFASSASPMQIDAIRIARGRVTD